MEGDKKKIKSCGLKRVPVILSSSPPLSLSLSLLGGGKGEGQIGRSKRGLCEKGNGDREEGGEAGCVVRVVCMERGRIMLW